MKRSPLGVCALAALVSALGACAPVVQGGPPLPLAPEVRDSARLGSITLSSDWLQSEEDFAETFSDEVGDELRACMTGGRVLNVRIHVDDLRRESRLGALLNGDGIHTVSGVVEFVDTQDGAVVGREFVSVATSAQGRLGGLFGDRQMMVSEEFGRALCDQAFGKVRASGRLEDSTR